MDFYQIPMTHPTVAAHCMSQKASTSKFIFFAYTRSWARRNFRQTIPPCGPSSFAALN